MRKKLLLTLCFTVFIVCLLALAVSAEVYNISYYDGGTLKETVQTDENGMLTARFSTQRGYAWIRFPRKAN